MSETIIKEVCFYPLRINEKGLIGFISLVIDNKLSLNSIAVYTRPDGNGYRLLFPSRNLPNGKEIQAFYPINQETYNAIINAVVQKIEELNEKVKGGI